MGLALEEQQNKDDKIVESNGTKIIYSKDMEVYLAGLTLEYTDDGINEGFRFTGGGIGSC